MKRRLILTALLGLAGLKADAANPGTRALRAAAAPPPPYKFVVVSDPDARWLADSYVALMKRTAPFSQMGDQLSFDFVDMTAEDMACANGCQNIERLICCADAKIAAAAASRGPHRVLTFTSKASGGSGGSHAVAGVGYPVTTMLHEVMHGYGFDDEYEYSAAEAPQYCGDDDFDKPVNVACFKPFARYRSNDSAKYTHRDQVPWMGSIKDPTLIVHGNALGTEESYPPFEPALYRGGDCNLVRPCWKPYPYTIMGGAPYGTDLTLLPDYYKDYIVKKMSAERGARITLTPLENLPEATIPRAIPVNRSGSPHDDR